MLGTITANSCSNLLFLKISLSLSTARSQAPNGQWLQLKPVCLFFFRWLSAADECRTIGYFLLLPGSLPPQEQMRFVADFRSGVVPILLNHGMDQIDFLWRKEIQIRLP